MAEKDNSTTKAFGRRETLKTLAIGTVSVSGLTGTALANPGNGKGRGNGNCDITVPDDYASIQDAIGSASSGDTICIDGGIYAEQLVINKSLSLKAVEGTTPTIKPGTSKESFMIAESGPTWEPMVFAFGGTVDSGDVSGAGTIDVDIEGLTLDGQSEQPDARRKPAVLYRNASGTIDSNTIKNVGVGGKETFGILAYGDSDVQITGNIVRDYERGGIGANGDGGAHPSPTAKVRNNTVETSGDIGEAWGPNGIQVGFGAEGLVHQNEVTGNRYSDEGPVAAGILIFESDGVSVKQNTVKDADIGLSCGSWGWFNASADKNQFTNNEVEKVEYGALLESVTEPYAGVPEITLTQMDASVSNNKVVNNTLKGENGPEGQIGVAVHKENNDTSSGYEPVAENNKLIRNSISNFETELEDEGTSTKTAPFKP